MKMADAERRPTMVDVHSLVNLVMIAFVIGFVMGVMLARPKYLR